MKSVVLMLAGLLLGAAAVAGEPVVVNNPVVTTDKSVDCRTVDSILKGLVKDGMTDEGKVIAVYHWCRRMISHGGGEFPLQIRFNFLYQMNVIGLGSCISQTTPLSVMLERLGYKTRTWDLDGHHCMQVKYGDKWHLLDPHTNFYVFDRSEPRTIASIEQIKADLTLVTDAVKEGRACPGFLLCGDDVNMFATKDKWTDNGDFPEGKKKPIIKEPFGEITLRRGETYVRTWMPGKYWCLNNGDKGLRNNGPYHSCRSRDRADSVNWPLYEPHGWEVRHKGNAQASVSYRHWAAGRILYKPDIAGDHYADAVVEQKNFGPGKRDQAPVLMPLDANAGGEVVFGVNCPYAIAAGEIAITRAGEGDLAVSVSVDRGQNWQPVEVATDKDKVTGLFVKQVNGSFAGYWLKIAVPAKAAIAGLELTSHFMLNAYSLPYLVPGKNVVSVEAGRFGAPLSVTCNWAEGDGWKEPKTVTKSFEKNGAFELDVAGPKYPRMESLVLSVAP